MTSSTGYVHALGYRWLNRFYDPLLRATMRERQFKNQLLDQAGLTGEMRVLDIGCGTGTLLMLATSNAGIRAIGLDGDSGILAIARGKRDRAGATFALVTALSTAMPFANRSFDRVFSTLMLHHLDDVAKVLTLAESRRVLTDSGELHIADWGRPHTPVMRIAAGMVRALDGADVTRTNLDGRLPELCRRAGFSVAELRRERPTPFGTLAFYHARK